MQSFAGRHVGSGFRITLPQNPPGEIAATDSQFLVALPAFGIVW